MRKRCVMVSSTLTHTFTAIKERRSYYNKRQTWGLLCHLTLAIRTRPADCCPGDLPSSGNKATTAEKVLTNEPFFFPSAFHVLVERTNKYHPHIVCLCNGRGARLCFLPDCRPHLLTFTEHQESCTNHESRTN